MSCNYGAGEFYVDFGNKSELKPNYYINQHPLNVNHIGFVANCTFYAADRVEQITGVDLEKYAGGWGNGHEWADTAKRFGFPVYNASEALNKRGTLAGYVISFYGIKAGYTTHVAVVESYNKSNKTAIVSEMWGSEGNCNVHLTTYYENELFNNGMKYIDFSSLGMFDKITEDRVKEIYKDVKSKRIYNSIDELPFGADTVKKLIRKGYIKGEDSQGNLGISYDLLRVLVINDRAGVYG